MNAARNTWMLAVAVGCLAMVDGIAHVLAAPAPAEVLGATPRFDAASVQTLSVRGPDGDVRLVRTPTGFALGATGVAADTAEVNAVLAALAGGVHPDLRAETATGEDLERYGLSGGRERWVEVSGADGTRLAAFAVGDDAEGGGTWIRLPDDDDVYLARIGGRDRLVRSAGAWRDRTVVALDPSTLTSLTIPGVVEATRIDGGWGPGVDGPTVEQVVAELAHLRGTSVVAADVLTGARRGPTITLGRRDGAPVGLTVWFRDAGVYVTRADAGVPADDVVWRVAGTWFAALEQPATFADRALWTLPGVVGLTVAGPGLDGALARGPDGWRILRPANVDVDPARADAAAAWLAAPRVLRWGASPPSEVGFPSAHTWTVAASAGPPRVLEIGRRDGDVLWVRDPSRPTWTGQVDARAVAAVEALFGGG